MLTILIIFFIISKVNLTSLNFKLDYFKLDYFIKTTDCKFLIKNNLLKVLSVYYKFL